MKTKMRLMPVLLLAAIIALMLPQRAEALTASGTLINNKATISYNVNSIAQPSMGSAPGAGNSTPGGAGSNTIFTVDNLIDVAISADNSNTVVTTYPGSPVMGQALKFTVSNLGNTTQDYVLSTIADPGNTIAGETVKLYKDDGGTPGTWDAGDTEITGSPRLSNIAAAGTAVVYIVIVPLNTALNGQEANYAMKAVSYIAGGGAIEVQTNVGAPNPTYVALETPDVVFGDGDGDGTGANDATYNGFYVKWENAGAGGNGPCGVGVGCDTFTVSAAQLTVTKTSAVIYDPILGVSANAKAIPGAKVEYTITIANAAASATATNVNISDTIDGSTTGIYGAYGVGLGVTVNFNSGGANAGTSASDGVDASLYDSSFVAGAVAVNGITLTAGQNVVIKYQVTIN